MLWMLLACTDKTPEDTARQRPREREEDSAEPVGDDTAPPADTSGGGDTDTADPSGSPGSTGGSGGATGLLDGDHTFEDQAGFWTLYVPDDVHDGPAGLAVLMHGDGGNHHEFTSELELRSWADDTHAMVLSLASPGPSRSGCWWTPRKHDRVDYVIDLLETHLFGAYDVDLERVHLGGISGGAFWSMGVPMYRELPFEGGFVGACGGDVPRENSDTDWCVVDYFSDDDPLPVEDSWYDLAVGKRVIAATTSGDEWTGHVEAGLALWEQLGADTQQLDMGTGGHCLFDTSAAIRDGLYWVEGRTP